MGRPKGSKNGKGKKVSKHIGVFKKSDKKEAEVVPSDIRTCKFFGYCKCDFIITRFEMVTKSIYECPRCGKRAKIKTLKKEMTKNSDRPTTKKEFLNGSLAVNRDHYNGGEAVIDIKDLKVAK